MDNITFIDASKARVDFFKILDWVYLKDKSFLIKKAGIPVAEISKPKSLLTKRGILEFAGIWSDIDNKKIIDIIYEGRKDKEKSKRKFPDF
ncbi:MAG: hypothetical protein AAB437_02050 [Patescibacteria group bacterium]